MKTLDDYRAEIYKTNNREREFEWFIILTLIMFMFNVAPNNSLKQYVYACYTSDKMLTLGQY